MSIDSQNSAEVSQILGIDFGKAKVGLALADNETKMAFAYKTVENNKELVQKLAEIISKENVKRIIIGIPSYINKGSVEYEGEKLGKLLEEILKIPVKYQNEMFTTKMAQANLIEKGAKDIKRFDDEESAKIILQEWLDNN